MSKKNQSLTLCSKQYDSRGCRKSKHPERCLPCEGFRRDQRVKVKELEVKQS